jgi:hypothetical protein
MSDKAQKRKATAPLVPDEEDPPTEPARPVDVAGVRASRENGGLPDDEDPPTEPARPEDAAGARDRAVRPREEEDSQLQHRLSGLETSED